jgi:glycosyltransferase involved in cell wall biosynthesis
MPAPLISVIVPVYNGEAFLAEALESIVCQAYTPLEIIVVDDGSTDGTAKVAARFPQVRYLYQTNRGPARARNAGLAQAQGQVITFLDADDVWSDDKLATQWALLWAHPEADLVLGHIHLVTACPRVDGQLCPALIAQAWLSPSLGAALIRRRAFERVGRLDETLPMSEDLDWFLRAREDGPPWFTHPETVLYYRQHAQNYSLRNPQADRYHLLALKKSLDRRRRKQP